MLATAAGNLAPAQLLMAAGASPFLRGSCAFETALLTGRLRFLRPYWANRTPLHRWSWWSALAHILSTAYAPLWLPRYYLSTHMTSVQAPEYSTRTTYDYMGFMLCGILAAHIVFIDRLRRWLLPYPLRLVAALLVSLVAPLTGMGISYYPPPVRKDWDDVGRFLAFYAVAAIVRVLLSVPIRRALWCRRRSGRVWPQLADSHATFSPGFAGPLWEA
jgi:hypothetical protein